MKLIKNTFDWYPHETWSWPDHDEKLLQVNDWVSDADVAMKYVDKFDVCIQAGGACGVWPAYLSNHFKEVFTFEPVVSNYECLSRNIPAGVYPFNRGLSDDAQGLYMALDEMEHNNCGAYYPSESLGGGCGYASRSSTIDGFDFDKCDLIALDIEGHEGKALKGAAKTIEQFSPVIMIEEKPLPHLRNGVHLEARKYLESIGYKQVDQIHRDVVFTR